MKKYDDGFYFRAKKKDLEKLHRDAEKAGISESAYLRGLINNHTPQSREDFLLIRELVTEINKIGVNINQIAAHANSGFYSEHEKRKLFALMNTLVRHTGQIIHGVEQPFEKNKEKEKV